MFGDLQTAITSHKPGICNIWSSVLFLFAYVLGIRKHQKHWLQQDRKPQQPLAPSALPSAGSLETWGKKLCVWEIVSFMHQTYRMCTCICILNCLVVSICGFGLSWSYAATGTKTLSIISLAVTCLWGKNKIDGYRPGHAKKADLLGTNSNVKADVEQTETVESYYLTITLHTSWTLSQLKQKSKELCSRM